MVWVNPFVRGGGGGGGGGGHWNLTTVGRGRRAHALSVTHGTYIVSAPNQCLQERMSRRRRRRSV